MNLFNIMEETTISTICDPNGSFEKIWSLVGIVFKFLLIGIPVILVIFGLMDLGKAVMAGKDDEIKAAQKLLIKRIIYTVVAFLFLTIVMGVLNIVGGTGSDEATVADCLDQIF